MVGGVAVAVVAGVTGGLIGAAVSTSSPSSSSAASPEARRVSSCSVTQIAEADLPSVVTISVQSATGTAGGIGSGEIIRPDGYILTNNHVVAVAAAGGSISVRLSNGKDLRAAIVGRDPLTDVAVVKASGASNLRPIPIGKSTKVVIGQPVAVLGAPLGLYSTVTSGIISAVDRTIEVPGEATRPAILINALQTDASINPGNSGGALVDCDAKFIGMPSAGATVPSTSGESNGGSIGLGFAIPSSVAIKEADQLISTGHVTRTYLGLQAEPLSANATTTTTGKSEGLLVTGIDTAGPAAAAGLRVGDVVTKIDGQQAERTDQLVAAVLEKDPGNVLRLGYERDGTTHTVEVTLGTRPTTGP